MNEKEQTPHILTDDQAKTLAEVERARAVRIHRAYRSHTRGLFLLWLILVNLIFAVAFSMTTHGDHDEPGIWVLVVTFWLMMITGGYIFQEIKRVHQRIDGILNMMEKK
jgi:hypothetical protein